MKRLIFSTSFALRSLSATVAALALLTACGGGDADPDPAPVPDPVPPTGVVTDDPDPATMTLITQHLAAVAASTEALGLPSATQAQSDHENGMDPDGRFPGVTQAALVANRPGFGAAIVDPELLNPWGIAIRPAGAGGHFWFAAANAGKSLEYVGDVGGTPLFQDDLKVVATGGPATGVAFNPGANFQITQPHTSGDITNAAKFMFANLSGTITAWTERARPQGGFDRPLDSVTVVDGTARHSSFVGVAIAPAGDRMLAADFGAEPALRVYNGHFAEQAAVGNPFRELETQRPDRFEAFNVQTLGQSLFATYGRHVSPTAPRPNEGRLAEFDASGQLVTTWPGRGYLNYPWGVALAPASFGFYAGCLLVGNFGDGTVVAFHPRHKVALDYVRDAHGRRVVIDGLWGLQFGNGASLGEANDMYFAAGPNREADGLVGKLEANARTAPLLGSVSLCREPAAPVQASADVTASDGALS